MRRTKSGVAVTADELIVPGGPIDSVVVNGRHWTAGAAAKRRLVLLRQIEISDCGLELSTSATGPAPSKPAALADEGSDIPAPTAPIPNTEALRNDRLDLMVCAECATSERTGSNLLYMESA